MNLLSPAAPAPKLRAHHSHSSMGPPSTFGPQTLTCGHCLGTYHSEGGGGGGGAFINILYGPPGFWRSDRLEEANQVH
ncbi:hypothetical protein NQZ68_035015 [Dissostichus eleginoides]|nr:hypothetical protein NQZ68_035015 [Dissostichus eleginoides]